MKKKGKSFFVLLGGLLGLLYILNPGAGWIEMVNDNIPFFGNLDEAAASALLISALAYFGLDITRIFKGKQPESRNTAKVIDAEEVPTKEA